MPNARLNGTYNLIANLTASGTIHADTSITSGGTVVADGDIYTNETFDYFSSSTKTGWTSPSGYIKIKKIGKTVFVWFLITGNSTGTSTKFTVFYHSSDSDSFFVGNKTFYSHGYVFYSASEFKIQTTGGQVEIDCEISDADADGGQPKTVTGQFFFEASS